MDNYIFWCVLRQPLYLLVLQHVKELNITHEGVFIVWKTYIDNLYYKKLSVDILSFPSTCLSIL